jgi:hypothetical protein
MAQRKSGQWFNPVKLPPLGKEGTVPLEWLGRVNDTGLGVTYVDFEGAAYTTTVGEELVRTHDGRRLPEWPEPDVARYWAVSPYDRTDPPRHPVDSNFIA